MDDFIESVFGAKILLFIAGNLQRGVVVKRLSVVQSDFGSFFIGKDQYGLTTTKLIMMRTLRSGVKIDARASDGGSGAGGGCLY